MIKVIIKNDNADIVNVSVSGHANSNEYGRDLVCAAVSMTCVGIANQLSKIGFMDDIGTIQLENGYLNIEVNQINHDVQLILETFETFMDCIEESYKQYIEIMKVEV